MSLKRWYKKAQATNWFAVIMVLFSSGFIIVLMYYIFDQFDIAFAGTSIYNSAIQTTAANFKSQLAFFDYLMVLLAAVLIIGVGITSYRVAASPVFAIITFILAAFYGFIAFYFNFIFQEMVGMDVFALVLVNFPRTILICTNLHWIMLANIIIGLITLFGKKEQGQESTLL